MGLFEDSYRQLNAAQKEAVDTINGPLLVVAGPGTGKTQLISMRVANILRQTDTDPANILCLTFTNKAALNMRERLITLTGGEAKGVMVRTFHSFAAELMNMYPDYFWNGARLTTAPDATQLDIIQTILSRLPLSNPLALKFAGNFTAGRDVKNALKYTKEAGLTPDKLKALVEANLAYIDVIEQPLTDILSAPLSAKKLVELQNRIEALPEQGISVNLQPLQDLGKVIKESLAFAILQDSGTGKTKHTGKWKQRWLQNVDGQKGMFKERERNTWWLALAGVYEKYRENLHARGYYDYADMIVEVISQLQQHANMRADVQERFLYVLIDEFQDTNAAQLQLANLIAGSGQPNLMAVGDDDQSIYKFNGAELSNMLSFRTSYPDTKLVVLTDNYRSSQAVLDTSAKIINQVEDRLTNRLPSLDKKIIAKNPPAEAGTIQHLRYPTEEHELSTLARRIASEHAASEGSIAVLARDHASLRRLAALLTNLNVPVSYEQQNNILEQPIISLIFKLCALLVSIQTGDPVSTDVLLSKVLPVPMWHLQPEQLWQLAVAQRRSGNWLDQCLSSKDQGLKGIAEWLVWLATEAQHQPLAVILEHILGLRTGEHLTSPLRQFYLSKMPADTEYLEALSAVRILLSLATDFAKSKQASLDDFVNFLQLSIDSGEVIADESVFVTGERAVHLLTVHKAKGLEFDTVHIINAIDANWRPSAGGRKSPANLPLQPVGDDQDDYARLLFVAATRAKRDLVVHSYSHDLAGREVMATPLLAEVLTIHDATDQVEPVQILEEHLAWPRLNATDEKRNLRDRLESFALSASSLLDFLDLSTGGPDNFFERHLLCLPIAKTANTGFGIAMHSALEYAQIATNGTGMQVPDVVKRFEQILADQYLPKHEYERFLEHGSNLLKGLLKSKTFWLGKGDLPEQTLSDIQLGRARIKGTLDRLHVNDSELTIIDYKTGKPLGSFTTRDQTKAVKAWRHRMQLTFYALLIENSSRFNPKSITGQMWYLEASSPKELIREYVPTADELTRLNQLIQVVWPKIQGLNLPDTRHYSADYSGIQAFEQDLLDGNI
jgi:DNA helicase-2/ATP-dependent DNA helicase PcrA